jgi:hypothetical protein
MCRIDLREATIPSRPPRAARRGAVAWSFIVAAATLAACSGPLPGLPDDTGTAAVDALVVDAADPTDQSADVATAPDVTGVDAPPGDLGAPETLTDLPSPEAGAFSEATVTDRSVVDVADDQGAAPDVSPPDAGTPDAMAPDAATFDATAIDAGTPDTGVVVGTDAAPRDVATTDTATVDAARVDTGATDTGAPDGGPGDVAAVDVRACVDACPRRGATRCAGAVQETCATASDGCLAWGGATACPAVCLDATRCDPCPHECPAWGATCSGDVLRTCYFDAMGCRRLMTQTCALGCADGLCRNCSTYADPAVGRVLQGPDHDYERVDGAGAPLLASWRHYNSTTRVFTGGLGVVDASRPDAMATLGVSTLVPSGTIIDFVRAGDRAYVLTSSELRIYATASGTPTLLGTFPLGPVTGSSLSLTGSLVCLGASDGVHLVDVSAPGGPVQRGLVPTTLAGGGRARCVGTRLALTTGTTMSVVDIADPAHPALVGQGTTVNNSSTDPTFAFDGTNAYQVSIGIYNRQVWYSLDSYGPRGSAPLAYLGSLPYQTRLRATNLVGTTLYVAHEDGAGAIDVSVPSAPRWIEHVATVAPPTGVGADAAGRTLFTAADGVTSFDLARSPDVRLLAAAGGALVGAEVRGSIAYVAREQRVVIEDLRNPTQPVVLSTMAVPARGIALRDRYAFVTVDQTPTAHLRVYDVGAPAAPRLVATLNPSLGGYNRIGRIEVSGDRAYALCGLGYLCVFDVRDPLRPTQLALVNMLRLALGTSTATLTFRVDGSHLVVPGHDRLYVYDFTTPTAVTTASVVYPTAATNAAARVDVSGHRAYVGRGCVSGTTAECLTVIDLSDPTRPTVVSETAHAVPYLRDRYPVYPLDSIVAAVQVRGDRVFFSHEWGGITMFDVASPTAPRALAEYWTTLPAREMFVIDRFLTAFSVAEFEFSRPETSTDQVVQLCP